MRLLVTCSIGQCLENKDIDHALTAPGVPLPRAFSAERTRNVACMYMRTEISDSNITSLIIPSLLLFCVCKSPLIYKKCGPWIPYLITCLLPIPLLGFHKKGRGGHKGITPCRRSLEASSCSGWLSLAPKYMPFQHFDLSLLVSMKAFLRTSWALALSY